MATASTVPAQGKFLPPIPTDLSHELRSGQAVIPNTACVGSDTAVHRMSRLPERRINAQSLVVKVLTSNFLRLKILQSNLGRLSARQVFPRRGVRGIQLEIGFPENETRSRLPRHDPSLVFFGEISTGSNLVAMAGSRGISASYRSSTSKGKAQPSPDQGTRLRIENRKLRTAFRSIIKRPCPSTPS
jgi:hypothetical protein